LSAGEGGRVENDPRVGGNIGGDVLKAVVGGKYSAASLKNDEEQTKVGGEEVEKGQPQEHRLVAGRAGVVDGAAGAPSALPKVKTCHG
jgi:hypothetical protein